MKFTQTKYQYVEKESTKEYVEGDEIYLLIEGEFSGSYNRDQLSIKLTKNVRKFFPIKPVLVSVEEENNTLKIKVFSDDVTDTTIRYFKIPKKVHKQIYDEIVKTMQED